MPTTGLTTRTVKRLVLDAGAVFRNWDPDNPAASEAVGATRGGAQFTVEAEEREVEVDGARGPIKELKRVIRHSAQLEVTFLEISEQLLTDLTRGTAAELTGTNFTEITPTNVIAPESFIDNITLVADVMGNLEPIALMVLNALTEGEWSVETDDEDEGQITVTFLAHYDLEDLSEVPYRILIPSDLDDT